MSKAKAIDFSDMMSETKEFKKVLLKEGTHASIIYGIIFLDEQKKQYDKNAPAEFKKMIKIKVEFPNSKKEDGTLVTLGSRDMNSTDSDKGNLYKLYAEAMGIPTKGDNRLTREVLKEAMAKNGLADMLGKPIGAKISHWDNGTKHAMSGLTDLPEGTLDGVKPTNVVFVFHPRFPDIDVWKGSIDFFTKKDIMASTKASEFPKELHDQWAIDQEENKKRQDEWAAKKEAKSAESDVGDVI